MIIKLEKNILMFESRVNKLAQQGFRIVAIEDNKTLVLSNNKGMIN